MAQLSSMLLHHGCTHEFAAENGGVTQCSSISHDQPTCQLHPHHQSIGVRRHLDKLAYALTFRWSAVLESLLLCVNKDDGSPLSISKALLHLVNFSCSASDSCPHAAVMLICVCAKPILGLHLKFCKQWHNKDATGCMTRISYIGIYSN